MKAADRTGGSGFEHHREADVLFAERQLQGAVKGCTPAAAQNGADIDLRRARHGFDDQIVNAGVRRVPDGLGGRRDPKRGCGGQQPEAGAHPPYLRMRPPVLPAPSHSRYHGSTMLHGGPLWHLGLIAGTGLLFWSSWQATQVESERTKAIWPLLMLIGIVVALLAMLLIAVPDFFTAAD